MYFYIISVHNFPLKINYNVSFQMYYVLYFVPAFLINTFPCDFFEVFHFFSLEKINSTYFNSIHFIITTYMNRCVYFELTSIINILTVQL